MKPSTITCNTVPMHPVCTADWVFQHVPVFMHAHMLACSAHVKVYRGIWPSLIFHISIQAESGQAWHLMRRLLEAAYGVFVVVSPGSSISDDESLERCGDRAGHLMEKIQRCTLHKGRRGRRIFHFVLQRQTVNFRLSQTGFRT